MRRKFAIRLMATALALSVISPLLSHSAGVPDLEANSNSPLFSAAIDRAKSYVDGAVARGIEVPEPKDAGGGYTHEQHKRNYRTIYEAGRIYALTGDTVYAEHAKALFLAYAAMYPTLGEHPQKKEQAPGRLFWQSLNESVWLVVAIQGYEAILPTLSGQERTTIEQGVLRPMAHFLSEGSPQTFDKIHNHGTWATAAVGMTGYVLGDQDMVEKALMGLDGSGKGGFLRQLDELFSPTGYYSEGPYYQRYALMPFVLFANAIEKNEPGRGIFTHRDAILLKAINTTIQLSYGGYFFPINDALKDKGLNTAEVMHAVSIAFDLTGDRSLLPIAEHQTSLPLTAAGLKVARALEAGEAMPFDYRTHKHADGAAGDEGALAVLRTGSGPRHQALVMKNTAQGMGHGHFDKLGWLYYDDGQEVVLDYGAARYLNVEAKNGGHYLPENASWAKQTVAHNTLVVDGTSHFGGKTKIGDRHHPVQLAFDAGDQVQFSAARMENAYKGVVFTRAMATIKDPALEFPFVLDVMKVDADKPHTYDLPLHYSGQLTETSVDLEANIQQWKPLGYQNGYQHLWVTARGKAGASAPARITWLNGRRFYTYSTLVPDGAEFLFTRLGANDPDFNLRSETAFISRVPKAQDTLFVSVLEPHGIYNPALEYTAGSHSQIRSLRRMSEGGKDLVLIETVFGKTWAVALSWNADSSAQHSINHGGQQINWTGFYTARPLGQTTVKTGTANNE